MPLFQSRSLSQPQAQPASQTLFRQEALDHQGERLWGSLILSQPVSYTICGAVILLIVMLALAFLLTNSYHRKEVISGSLVPDKGMVSIPSPGSGRIIAVHVIQDQPVEAGQLLFDVQLDESAGADGPYSTQLLHNLNVREARLAARLRLIDERQRLLLESRETRITAIRANIRQLETLLQNGTKLLDLKTIALERAERLGQRLILAESDVDAVRVDFLMQENAVAGLDLRLLEARRELANARWERHDAELSSRENRLTIENELTALRQERIRLRAGIRNEVLSPVAGVVASVSGQVGQFVDTRRDVLALIPEGSVLQAEFFVPSRAVGFLNEGQDVQLRFDAFPYQKFGVHGATISGISNNVLGAAAPGTAANPEARYRVVARLRSQSVRAYGENIPLKPGMTLSANVILDERSLFEWLMEPLYSVTGKG